MKLHLQRTERGDRYTMSRLAIDGVAFCDTLESTDRHLDAATMRPEQKVFGQTAFAEGEQARLFGCERKTIQRLVESMRALQLVSTNSTNRATVFTLLYLSGWLIEGNMVRNLYYHRPLAKTRQETFS